MALILNENIDSAMQRWQAWFDGTLDEGPLIYVESPLGFFREELRPMTLPDNAEKIWTDIDFRDAGSYNYMISSFFGGDAVPMYFVNLGPGSVASYLGSTPLFDNSTVWFGQLQDNRLEKVYEHLVYDPQNPYWVLTKEYTRRLLETANGDYHISIADLGGSLDILSSLRGAQNVLMDLIDQPELVHLCEDKICDLWMIYFNELKQLFDQSPQKGYITWMHLWSENPWYPLQCDISNMISPAMYEEFVMPRLTRTARELGQAVYHLDGPGEWQHLDYILSIPEIKAIQYQSVDTDPPNESSHWLPYYRRIAEAGKGVFFYVYTQDIEQVYKLSQEMPAEKLAFHMWLPSKEDAQALLKRFKR